jgi:hypothetical protein
MLTPNIRPGAWLTSLFDRSGPTSSRQAARSSDASHTSVASCDKAAPPSISHSRTRSENKLGIVDSLALRLRRMGKRDTSSYSAHYPSHPQALDFSAIRSAAHSLQALLHAWHEPLRGADENSYAREFKAHRSACASLASVLENFECTEGVNGKPVFRHVPCALLQDEKSRSSLLSQNASSWTSRWFSKSKDLVAREKTLPAKNTLALKIVHDILKEFAGEHRIYDKYVELAAILKERLASPEAKGDVAGRRPETGMPGKADVRESLYRVALKIDSEPYVDLSLLANYDINTVSEFLLSVKAWGEHLKEIQRTLPQAYNPSKLEISCELARPRSQSRSTMCSAASINSVQGQGNSRKPSEWYQQEINSNRKSQRHIDLLIERAENRQRERLAVKEKISTVERSLARLAERSVMFDLRDQPAYLFKQAYSSTDHLVTRGLIREATERWKTGKARSTPACSSPPAPRHVHPRYATSPDAATLSQYIPEPVPND